MSKLDELHTIEKLLNEFELPVSPILEYAISEKVKDLRAEGLLEMKVMIVALNRQ